MSEHELWNELGNLYFLSGAYDQAINAYRRSIQLDVGFGRPYSNLALTYVKQEKYDEAAELYRRSIELLTENHEKAITWYGLGDVYRHLKDYSKAVIAYHQADDLDPEGTLAVESRFQLSSPAVDLPALQSETARSTDHAGLNTIDEPESAAGPSEPSIFALTDEANASWTTSDPGEVQQDFTAPPEAVSLTTWGETESGEDEGDAYMPPEPGTEIFAPDPDGDDLSTWLPMPEDEFWREVQAVAYGEEAQRADSDEEAVAVQAVQFQAAQPTGTLPRSSAMAGGPLEPRHTAQDDVHMSPVMKLPVEFSASQESPHPQEVDTEVDLDDGPSENLPTEFSQEAGPVAPFLPIEDVEEQLPHAGAPLETPNEAIRALGFEAVDPDELQEMETEIAKFQRVVQINPRNAHAWDALGTLFKSTGRYRDAILAYQQAISSDSTKSLYYHHLGLVYACEGRDEDAIDAFQHVIEIDPEHSLAHATLGGYFRKMGLEDLAQKHIGKAMKSIFDSENEYNRACLEAICGHADQAIELLRVALKNKQTYVDWILRDPDLDFIRQDPRFKQLISDFTR